MKKIIKIQLGLLCFLAFANNSNAQKTEGIPYSFNHPINFNPEVVLLESPTLNDIVKEDVERDHKGLMYRYGIGLENKTTSFEKGTWQYLKDGSKLWRITFIVPNAKALAVNFSQLELPAGSSFFVYNSDKSMVSEEMNRESNPDGNIFCTRLIKGDEITLEYFQPNYVAGYPVIEINDIVWAYRAVSDVTQTKEFGDSEACQVNARCSPESNNYQNQIRSVVRISVKDGSSYGWCSGALINNAKQDCSPYVLTANHCGGGASVGDLKSWVFYFNYESPDCNNPASQGTLATSVVTGAMKLANASNVSNVVSSDFMLVLMSKRPNASFNAYFSGWLNTNTAPTSGVSIHHPAGDIKKISTFTQTATSSAWSFSTPNTHWSVKWSATANGHGVTEGGSSGSPLFDANGRIVGILSGGSSFCTPPSSLNSPDVYGKFSHAWNMAGTTADKMLKSWLDPLNSGITSLSGKENNCTAATTPTVDFIANPTDATVNQEVQLTDQTPTGPFAWEWNFNPTTATYVSPNTNQSQNPKVKFTNQGNYSVTLYAGNNAGYGTKYKPGYIKVTGTSGESYIELKDLRVFPIPSAGVVNVDLGNKNYQKITLAVYDLAGRKVFTKTMNSTAVSIDLSFLIDGIYSLELVADSHRSIRKISIVK